MTQAHIIQVMEADQSVLEAINIIIDSHGPYSTSNDHGYVSYVTVVRTNSDIDQ